MSTISLQEHTGKYFNHYNPERREREERKSGVGSERHYI
jgi:hypothetical protein